MRDKERESTHTIASRNAMEKKKKKKKIVFFVW